MAIEPKSNTSASRSKSSPASTSKSTSSSRRAALREQREHQAASTARKRLLTRIGVVAAVIAALVAGIAVSAWFANRPVTPSGEVRIAATGPAHSTPAGAVRIGKADAPVTVSVYSDFSCSYCRIFEQANAQALSERLTAGKIKVDLYVLNFLDDASGGTRYSTRAANAFATVANADPDLAWNYYQLLFAQQPEEGSAGLSDTQLVQLAEQAGADRQVTAAFGKLAYRGWTEEVNRVWFPIVKGTPTIHIDGAKFDGDPYVAGPLGAAIDQAAG